MSQELRELFEHQTRYVAQADQDGLEGDFFFIEDEIIEAEDYYKAYSEWLEDRVKNLEEANSALEFQFRQLVSK